MTSYFLILLSLFSLSLTNTGHSKTVPQLSGPVVDQAEVFSTAQKAELSQALQNFKQEHGKQLQVLTVKDLGDETLEGYSIKVTDQWKLGSESGDNGVLFLVAVNDRQMRIEVGQGLEGELTDLTSGRIIQVVTPYFKQGNYALGITLAMQSIAGQLGGKLKLETPVQNDKKYRSTKHGGGLFFILFILLMIFGRGRRGGLGWFLLGSMAGGSRRGGGGGFGGWSGGGGGFSGGGASGRW